MKNETENRLLYLFIKNVIYCEISRFSEREMFKSEHQNEHNITYQLPIPIMEIYLLGCEKETLLKRQCLSHPIYNLFYN